MRYDRYDELEIGQMYVDAKGQTVLVVDTRPEPAKQGFVIVEFVVIEGPEPLKRGKTSRPNGAKLGWTKV